MRPSCLRMQGMHREVRENPVLPHFLCLFWDASRNLWIPQALKQKAWTSRGALISYDIFSSDTISVSNHLSDTTSARLSFPFNTERLMWRISYCVISDFILVAFFCMLAVTMDHILNLSSFFFLPEYDERMWWWRDPLVLISIPSRYRRRCWQYSIFSRFGIKKVPVCRSIHLATKWEGKDIELSVSPLSCPGSHMHGNKTSAMHWVWGSQFIASADRRRLDMPSYHSALEVMLCALVPTAINSVPQRRI